MNQGRTLQELATEVERQKNSKRDFLAVTRELSVYTPNRKEYGVGETELDLSDHGNRPINNYAHSQLATHLGIPKSYYDRLRTNIPDLFDTNVNTLLRMYPEGKKGPDKRFVRTLDGRVRAFLSDTYRPIDNSAMVGPLFTELSSYPGLHVDSSEITETRFILKVSTPRLMGEVKVGDAVQMGVAIWNSEVGRGRWRTMPFVKRLVCVNGAIFEDYGTGRTHVGRRLGYGDNEPEDIYAYMSDETLAADNHAFFLKVRDSIRAIMVGTQVLDALLDKMSAATQVKLRNPEAAVAEVTRWADLSEDETTGVMRHLIEGGDLSLWGLSNAITAAADSVHPARSGYERNTDMQSLGGRIITLDPSEYKVITEASTTHRRGRAPGSGDTSLYAGSDNQRALENSALSVY